MKLTRQKIQELVAEIFFLYQQYGYADYIGEPVSQIEHMSQAAGLALEEGFDNEVVLAAFFHDIGHICTAREDGQAMDAYGILSHEKAGAEYLKSCGFSNKITSLVANHVSAKRYLIYKDPDYYNALSEASKKTLKFQRGIMSPREARLFETSPYFMESIRLRKWDERAKKTDIPLLDMEMLKKMACKHLEENMQRQNRQRRQKKPQNDLLI